MEPAGLVPLQDLTPQQQLASQPQNTSRRILEPEPLAATASTSTRSSHSGESVRSDIAPVPNAYHGPSEPRASMTSLPAEYVPHRLQDIPRGYPRFAAFQDKSDGFMIFRRFGTLHTRLLLEKQRRVFELEEKLAMMDYEDTERDPYSLQMPHHDRSEFFQHAEKQLREYADMMTTVQRLRSFDTPTQEDWTSVRNYMYNTQEIMGYDRDFMQQRKDLVAIRPPKDPDWLEWRLERLLLRTIPTCFDRTTHDGLWIPRPHAQKAITSAATTIVAFLAAVLLVLPVLICYLLVVNVGGGKGYAGCIGVLFLFTIIFSCAMAFYSKAKRHEVLAATAAYCAVIVVFLGNAAQS